MLTYVSFPILANIYIVPLGPVQLFVSGGIEYSLLVQGKTYDHDLEEELEDIKSKMVGSDTAYLVGGGLRFNLKVTEIILEGRYAQGQKDVFLPEYLEEGEFFRNRVFSFGIGFTF